MLLGFVVPDKFAKRTQIRDPYPPSVWLERRWRHSLIEETEARDPGSALAPLAWPARLRSGAAVAPVCRAAVVC
jgi:hypothetical protein